MRKKSVRALAVLLVAILAALALAGCGDDTAKANDAVEAANVKSKAYAKLDGEIQGLMDEIDGLGTSDADIAKSMELLDTALAKIEEQAPLREGVKAEFDKISAMNVSEDAKKYASQQVEITELQAKYDDTLSQMLSTTKEMFAAMAAGTLDEAGLEKIKGELEPLGAAVDKLAGEINDKSEASSKFFDENLK